jgi:hypothetical protein
MDESVCGSKKGPRINIYNYNLSFEERRKRMKKIFLCTFALHMDMDYLGM